MPLPRKLTSALVSCCLALAPGATAWAGAQSTPGRGPGKPIVLLPGGGARLQTPGQGRASVGDIILLQFQSLLGGDPAAALGCLRVTARSPLTSDERSATRHLLRAIAAPESLPPAFLAALQEGLGEESLSSVQATAKQLTSLASKDQALESALADIRRELSALDLGDLEMSAEVFHSFYTSSNPRKPGVFVPKSAAQAAASARQPDAALAPRPSGLDPTQPQEEAEPGAPRRGALAPDFLEAKTRYQELKSALAAVDASRARLYEDAYDARRAPIYRAPVVDDLSAHFATASNEMRRLEALYPQLRHWGKMKLLGVGGLLAALSGFAGAVFLLLAANIPVALALGLIGFTGTITAYRVAGAVAAAETPKTTDLKALGIPDNPLRPLLAIWAFTGGVIALGSAAGLALAGKPVWTALTALKGAAEFWLAWRLRTPKTPSGPSTSAGRLQKGFTLAELLVGLAVLGGLILLFGALD